MTFRRRLLIGAIVGILAGLAGGLGLAWWVDISPAHSFTEFTDQGPWE